MRTRHLLLASALVAGDAATAWRAAAAADAGQPPREHRGAPATQRTKQAAGTPGDTAERIQVRVSRTQRAAHTIDHETIRLQNVAQAATHVEARELKAEHASALPQAVRLLPTVQLNISNPRNTTINIRGLGAAGTAATDGIEGGVAVYVDGVYRSRPGTALSDIAGLDGITVLRGPAGTEGGMTATAGAIALTTAAPDLVQRHVSVEAGAGSYAYNRWGLSVSTPLIANKLAIRIDTLGYGYDGWVRNLSGGGDLNGVTNRSVRAQILAQPTDALSVRIIADYSHLRENCCSGGLYRIDTTRTDGTVIANNLYQEAARVGYTPVRPSDAPYVQDRNALSDASQEDEGVSAQVDWHHDRLTLSSITAYRWWNWWPHNDGDLSSVDVIGNNNAKVNERQLTQEFRLSSSLGHVLDYRVGAFYMWQENDVYSDVLYGSQAGSWYGYGTGSTPVKGVTAAQANILLNGYNVRAYDQPTTNYYAAYADGTWHLTPHLDLVTGARYNYDAKTGSYLQSEFPSVTYAQAGVSSANAQSVWNTYGSNSGYGAYLDNGFVTGQAALRYRISDDLMVYARYGHGGKSGGLNLGSFSLTSLRSGAVSPNVSKETDDSFEVGSKIQLLQNRLVLSGALYQTNDHNYQVTAVQLFQGTLQSYLSNAPRVRVRGAEADLHYSPLPNLITTLSASYNDAQFLEYNTTAPPEVVSTGLYSLARTQVPFVPRWSLSAAAEYSHHLGRIFAATLDGYVGGSYGYNTRINTSANNAAVAWVSGYGTLNLHFGIRDPHGRWDLSGFVNNATDERHATQITQGSGASGNGAWYAYVTEPLNAGVIARFSY